MKYGRLIVLFGELFCTTCCMAQTAVKTNLLYDAATTPNIGLEKAVGRKQSVQLFYSFNPWKYGENEQFRHWIVNPEYRWWFCHTFNGSFVGLHAFGGEFNVGGVELPFGMWKELKDSRYEGWLAGAGISYGYQWVVSRHWNFEASVGVGYAYIDYQKFRCGNCGKQEFDGHKNYFGPTKLALSVMYVF
ncbi:MAG: DUF3575 domain-containing protein [Roseburia sp.]|nr:DUF3575 domain-containing protein [Roseburia sp.]